MLSVRSIKPCTNPKPVYGKMRWVTLCLSLGFCYSCRAGRLFCPRGRLTDSLKKSDSPTRLGPIKKAPACNPLLTENRLMMNEWLMPQNWPNGGVEYMLMPGMHRRRRRAFRAFNWRPILSCSQALSCTGDRKIEKKKAKKRKKIDKRKER